MSKAATGAAAAAPRAHNDGSSGRAFTPDQKAAVTRVRRCKATAFYDILGLEAERTTVGEAGIKKAYRKLSLLTHPDKNGCDGADEAFKSEWALACHPFRVPARGRSGQPVPSGVECVVREM